MAGQVSSWRPPWLDIHIASTPNSWARSTSFSSVIPFKINLSLYYWASYFNFLTSSQVTLVLILCIKEFSGLSRESKLIYTPNSLKTYKLTCGENLLILSILRLPNVWVSTVNARAWNPFLATILTNYFVYYAFLRRYNWCILIPDGFTPKTYEGRVVDSMLNP